MNEAELRQALQEENCKLYEQLMEVEKELLNIKTDRDYWKAEALKHCAKLGEIKLLIGGKIDECSKG